MFCCKGWWKIVINNIVFNRENDSMQKPKQLPLGSVKSKLFLGGNILCRKFFMQIVFPICLLFFFNFPFYCSKHTS
uniref:Uncharacterized protein n=1 Tax=Rhizophora mucronata TaxID=61149 RepID=A0A2P2NXL2_RHIMU